MLPLLIFPHKDTFSKNMIFHCIFDISFFSFVIKR